MRQVGPKGAAGTKQRFADRSSRTGEIAGRALSSGAAPMLECFFGGHQVPSRADCLRDWAWDTAHGGDPEADAVLDAVNALWRTDALSAPR